MINMNLIKKNMNKETIKVVIKKTSNLIVPVIKVWIVKLYTVLRQIKIYNYL